MYQNKHIFIFFFCFSSDTYKYFSDEILQPNRIRIKLYWITTYIDQLIVISILEIPKDSGIIQIGQVRHIIHFIKFGRIDLENLLFFQILFLKTKQIICVVWFLLYMSKPKSICTYLIGLVVLPYNFVNSIWSIWSIYLTSKYHWWKYIL